ncbi:MAG: arginine--tRNA ligase [Candidatus Pacebacteria bacterium CG_4_10_14_0_8_um_filter_43_12]|nr:MAG: arginine--tRNA ligase [Candidatus Pacebacteria bacterium CG_4_10_14_0_8_um_filter_43_12]
MTIHKLYPLAQLKQEVITALQKIDLPLEVVNQVIISRTPEQIEGDFGFHCAAFSVSLKKSPNEIAQELAAKLQPEQDGYVQSFLAIGPYLNLQLNFQKFGQDVVENVLDMGADYGKEKQDQEQKIIIDMSSPNIAKRMSVGHLRSTIIGDSLAKILAHLGHRITKDNHLGDWGTQFGHLLRALELWGDPKIIEEHPIEELQKLYVRINQAADPKSEIYQGLSQTEAEEKAAKIVNEGRAWFKRLEDGDPNARAKWQEIVDWSMLEFQKMYTIFGVEFDWVKGESFYEDMLQPTIARLEHCGIVTKSEGALVIDMEDQGLRTVIIKKSDGATLYLTRDIATALYRSDQKFDAMIYVVGEDQKFYFEQLFGVLKEMGLKIAEKSKHVYFGLIRLTDGKMSTRKGRVIFLEDLVNEALERTKKLVENRTQVTDAREKERLVKQIAIGALKWNDLMADPKRTIIFDWDKILTMEGNSAPYVQYAQVRAASMLKGIDPLQLQKAIILAKQESECKLISLLALFPEAILSAAEEYDPSKIAIYVYDLAKTFSTFYHDLPILKETNSQIQQSRLAITAAVAETLKVGLALLGIEAPEKM